MSLFPYKQMVMLYNGGTAVADNKREATFKMDNVENEHKPENPLQRNH